MQPGSSACCLRYKGRQAAGVSFWGRLSHFGTGKRKAVANALTKIAPSDPSGGERSGGGRARADFLAQLIATLSQAPQTRTRRRAEPEEAVAAYGARERASAPPETGHVLSRSL